MGYSNFFFFRQIYYILKRSKRFRILLLTLIILFVFYKVCFGASVTLTQDLEEEITFRQKGLQNMFVYHSLTPYLENTDMWNEQLSPLWEEIREKGVYIDHAQSDDDIKFTIYTFDVSSGSIYEKTYWGSTYNYSATIMYSKYTNATKYVHHYYPSSNTGSLNTTTSQELNIPVCIRDYKSELLLEFQNYIHGYSMDGSANLLAAISSSLDDIEDLNEDIITSLNALSSSLSAIQSNTSTNYSQQISAISGKIDDILDDNQEIISQNTEMIEQQEQINENLEQVSSDIQEVNDTLTDDTVESTASDLPSTDVQDPTQAGIATIFQSIYNAFCTGQAQDIVFPIPFTDKNITLSPYYVRDMLNNNGAGWVYTLIQAFWGYLIGRFIVSDISKKIDKVKSGNIENIENTNIKEEML